METSQDVGEALRGRIRARYGATVLIGSSLLALLLVGGAFCVWAWGPDELESKLEQVRLGMTEDEVKAIMGTPDQGMSFFESTTDFWRTDRITARTSFASGKLYKKAVERKPLWDRIRAKLPW